MSWSAQDRTPLIFKSIWIWMIYYRSLYLKANLSQWKRSIKFFLTKPSGASSKRLLFYLSTCARDFFSVNYGSGAALFTTGTNPPFPLSLSSGTTSSGKLLSILLPPQTGLSFLRRSSVTTWYLSMVLILFSSCFCVYNYTSCKLFKGQNLCLITSFTSLKKSSSVTETYCLLISKPA